jgi:hypothetical protein
MQRRNYRKFKTPLDLRAKVEVRHVRRRAPLPQAGAGTFEHKLRRSALISKPISG